MLMNGFDGQITTAAERRRKRSQKIGMRAGVSPPANSISLTVGSQRNRTK